MSVIRSKTAKTEVYECLSGRRRREVLSVLQARDGAVSERDLAERVAARIDDAPRGAGPSEDRVSRVQTGLHHTHVPKLAEVGLVERRDDGVALETDHPALGDPAVEWATETSAAEDRLDAVFEALADGRRQRVLEALVEMYHPLEPREIAVLVAAREENCSPQSVSTEAVDSVHTSLHHVHLPVLAEADLVERDESEGTVTYDDSHDLPVAWVTPGAPVDSIEAR